MRGILLKPDNQDAYMWAHDKLQQVSYSLIPDELKSGLHSTLGGLIWRMRSKCHDQEWMIFMAADQLNRFSDCQHGKVLGAEVASLCLEAAKLSLSKSALFPAFDMMMAGMNHLAVEGRWTTHYDLTLRLGNSACSSESTTRLCFMSLKFRLVPRLSRTSSRQIVSCSK